MGKASDFFRPDRYRSQARLNAERTYSKYPESIGGTILPSYKAKTESTHKTGGLREQNGRGSASGLPASEQVAGGDGGGSAASRGARVRVGEAETTTHNDIEDALSQEAPPPAPPPHKSEDAGYGHSPVNNTKGIAEKPTLIARFIGGVKRFGMHTKNALFHSWVNVLLVFVPVGIAVNAVGLDPAVVFALNAVAIVPLAGMLSHATESVASRLGDTLGALLNVSFGNAVELIIFIIALVKNEIRIVQASLLGSILANLLLILGMAFLFGGLRFREQIYNSTVTQMSACLLSLSVMSLLLPTAFYASFNSSSTASADAAVLRVSRGTSVVLLLVYILYLLFQLKSHAYMYESTPQEIIDEESHPGVLADILGSSSSSDTSSSSDDSDSDTSGSIMTTGKKIRKRMFKHRRRRKSSGSASSTTASSVVPSALSSPSTTERAGNYWESQVNSPEASRRESALGVIASGDETDADNEDGGYNNGPRIRDFVNNNESAHVTGDTKSPERKRRRRKHRKRHHKKRHHHEDNARPGEKMEDPDIKYEMPRPHNGTEPKVEFADDVAVVESQDHVLGPNQSPRKLAHNMRQLSSRVAYRPALPKMLSQTVFNTPAPTPEPVRRPMAFPMNRVRSEGNGLRRTSSLPDRLNRQQSNLAPVPPTFTRSEPLPPFQHQRTHIRRVNTEDQDDHSEESDGGAPAMSRTAAIVLLIVSTALVAVCAEFMVNAIPGMIASSPVSQAFVGLIILPIVGNAAEHVTAVTVATKNKMDLAIGVAVGSSIQIALFVTPVVVLLGWILGTNMSLYFNIFETVSLFVTAFVVNFLVLDGRSNYLEGSLLIAAYIIIAVGAFYYPSAEAQSAVGGGASD